MSKKNIFNSLQRLKSACATTKCTIFEKIFLRFWSERCNLSKTRILTYFLFYNCKSACATANSSRNMQIYVNKVLVVPPSTQIIKRYWVGKRSFLHYGSFNKKKRYLVLIVPQSMIYLLLLVSDTFISAMR